jgi:hypothetical protein
MVIWLIFAFIAALFEAIAVQKNNVRLEFIGKPYKERHYGSGWGSCSPWWETWHC